MSFLCKWFHIGCPKPQPPQPPPTSRWISVDVDGPTDFSGVLQCDDGQTFVGERVEPVAPWHMSFRVPTAVTCGFYIAITSQDPAYVDARVRGSFGGKTVDELGGIPTVDCNNDPIVCPDAHFDPSNIPLDELARIRGAMWTETLNISKGPRPNQPTNIAATNYLFTYPEDERQRIVDNLRSLGYTHCVASFDIGAPDGGYHGIWPSIDYRQQFDVFLDQLQYMWDNGLAPIVFLHPDNWSLEDTTRELTPFLQQPRAQKLIRIIVPSGWEPTKYDWSSQTWTAYAKWGRETLPNALCLIHTVCDVDAPVGTDARGDDNGKDNALGWHRIAPYIHGWLTQTCTYERKDGITDGKTNFQNWVNLFNPAVRGSYQDRFRNGYAGWPTYSAWGAAPLKVYAAEYLAYWTFWQNAPKEESRTWGNAAMQAGADGYLDGGTVPVGSHPVPWQK
jgi:hypothetical protein